MNNFNFFTALTADDYVKVKINKNINYSYRIENIFYFVIIFFRVNQFILIAKETIMKKISILLAFAVIVASVFVSCGSTKPASGEVKSAAVKNADSTPDTTPNSH